MIFRIKTSPTNADSVQVVRLDGADYQIRLTWYERAQRWLCGVATYPDLTPIVEGVTLRGGQLITRWADSAVKPAGALICVDLEPSATIPARSDLGSRLELLYVDAEGVETLQTEPDTIPTATSVVIL